MVHCGGGGRHSCSGDADGGGRSSGDEQQPDQKSGEENGSAGVPWPQIERRRKQGPAENPSLLTFLSLPWPILWFEQC